MKKGKIIFLNGVTSSGKTTIAKTIQDIAKQNYFYLSNDMFQQMISEKFLIQDYWLYLGEAILGMYYTAKQLSNLNINVIIDGMLLEEPKFPFHYEKMLKILSKNPLFIVEIFCPLDECKKRNIARGDRKEDQSEWQYRDMAKNIEYDITVNTMENNAEQCAKAILNKCIEKNNI